MNHAATFWSSVPQIVSIDQGSSPEQDTSMRRLKDYQFEWVLPGHGQRVRLPVAEIRGSDR